MSMYAQQIEDAAAIRADFDQFLRENDEENASACIDRMGESYSELEAMKMHREMNVVFNDVVPFEQEIPVMTEAEKNAWTIPERHAVDYSNGRDAERLEELHLGELARKAKE